ncbi:monocarboxylate transporter 13-like, partial [Ixodes scapularis]|uniref:monocarboxylate transporter 13-like n=1 Tax=Ixodes scapularis TaxID=6945 RepID=UPI001C382779
MPKVAVTLPAASSKPEARHQVPDSPRAWYLGILCTIYGFFSWAGIGSSPVLYVGLLRRSGASREDASLPFTAMVCAYYVGSLVYGVLSRWLKERTLLVAASLVTSLSLLTSYFISDIGVLTVVLGVIHGTGVAVVGVVCGMLLSQYFVKYRATAFGLMSVTLSTTGVAFPPLAAWLLDGYGFAATLLVLGALSLHQLVCCVPLETWTPAATSASPPHEADRQQALAVATIDQGVLQAHREENEAST